MRAIFLKELRENIVWALLALLAISATITGVAIDAHHSAAFLQPVMVNKRMTPATQGGFSVVGLLLGLLAILHDGSVGRRAFLFHRPVTRSRIFLGKFCAALLLYLMATALPLAGLTIWAAVPGDVVAPFDWHMVLPRLADLIGGGGFLAAGMLVAARTRARWLGSRLFPLALPLIALSIATQAFTSIWPAMAVLAGTVVVLVPAAWGTFIRGGEYESQPWIGRVTHGIALTAGVLVVLLPVEVLVTFVAEPLVRLRPIRPTDVVYRYILADNGQVVVEKSRGDRQLELNDPGGNSVKQFAQSNVETLFINGFSDIRPEEVGPFSADAYAQAIVASLHPTNWFYMPQRRTVEGYDSVTCRFAGSIGPNGYSTATAAPTAFADDLKFYSTFKDPGNLTVFGRESVWRLSMYNPPRMQLLYRTESDEPIVSIGDWSTAVDPSRTWRIPMVTKSALHVFPSAASSSRDEIARIPLEPAIHNVYQVSVAHPDAGRFAMLYLPDGPLVETDGAGNIIRRMVLPKLPQLPGFDYRPISHRGFTAEYVFTPPAAAWALALGFRSRVQVADVVEWIAIGMASALAGWVLMGRYSTSSGGRWVWTILCGMLGIPGVVLLVCTRQATARAPCGNCGRPRLVANDLCEHCGAPFPPPGRKDIDLFAADSARHQLEVKVSL